jgi:hypothetical protein
VNVANFADSIIINVENDEEKTVDIIIADVIVSVINTNEYSCEFVLIVLLAIVFGLPIIIALCEKYNK